MTKAQQDRVEFRPAPGRAFFTGCNYWASHAGTRMWTDWRPDVVAADLKQVAGAGLAVLRVFPLWPDFQPIRQLAGYAGRPVEIRVGEEPLPASGPGAAGVDDTMLDRFAFLADTASAQGLRLIVGLVTGWMSSRLYVPPALEGRNVLTDPTALRWQIRFVRVFVERFKAHPAIAAWDLGNECNCMGATANPDEAWTWTSHLASAIRAADPSRPIVSGMHSLSAGEAGNWRIADQAELTDVLTTHPYPVFTPHCDRDPVNTVRPGLHAVAESRLYEDIGGKPCFAEELGTLGPMTGSESVAAAYVRSTLFSLWAHGCHGMLWWCAYDQDRLTHAPYDWSACERELGLFRADRSPKPALEAMSRFARWVDRLPVRPLPPRLAEAVCVVPARGDAWGAAYSSFVLAKQAGLDVTFAATSGAVPDAPLYLLPSVSGLGPFSRRFWFDLLGRVERGASLYLSHDDCFLSHFKDHFGLEVETRARRERTVSVRFEGAAKPAFTLPARIRLVVKAERARVLASEEDGNSVFTEAAYGKGRLYFLAVPLEKALAEQAGAFHRPEAPPYADVYRAVAAGVPSGRIFAGTHPSVGVTEHPLADGRRVVVAVNGGPEPVSVSYTLSDGWRPVEAWYGERPADGLCRIGPNDAAVFVVVGGQATGTHEKRTLQMNY